MTEVPKEQLKSKHSSFFKKIHRVVIRNLTFEIFLQTKHNSFHALLIPN